MNRHDYAVLTLRGSAIYVWICGLEYLLTYGTTFLFGLGNAGFRQFNGNPTALGLLIIPAVDFWVGAWLFACSHRLADLLLPATANAPTPEVTLSNPLSGASIAFAVIGIFFFIGAVPPLVTSWVAIANTPTAVGQVSMVQSYLPRMIGAIVQAFLVFFLFLKARALATVWWGKQQR